VIDAKWASLTGEQKKLTALNGVNAMAYSYLDFEEATELADLMFNEDYENLYSSMERAGRDVFGDDAVQNLLGNGLEKAAVLAAIMGQEGAAAMGLGWEQTGAAGRGTEETAVRAAETVYASLTGRFGGGIFTAALEKAAAGASAEGPRIVEWYKENPDMSTMTITDMAQYLIQREYLGSQMEGAEKGAEAKNIRDIVYVGERLNTEAVQRIKNLDKLFAINEGFMNITLRDFLSVNDDGSTMYNEPEEGQGGWKTSWGNFYHLDPDYSGIVKYENKFDGRELIFGLYKDGTDRERLRSSRFADTYNYAAGTVLYTFVPGMPHDKYDVQPYLRQYPGNSVVADTLNYYLFREKK
jgi:hypothetical protein